VAGRPAIADLRSLFGGPAKAENLGMPEFRDAIDLLVEDHRFLEELLERLDREDDPREMRALFLRIAGDLAAHEAAEHEVVFPAARAAGSAGTHEVHELIGEHEEVNSLLAEMLTLDASGAGFAKRASALVFELRAHFAEEEERLFPALRAVLDPAYLAWLAPRVRAIKRSAPMFPAA
jgi:iron-sulfur cluster repair protein YtfE (RIC family)